jgi:hypothetical protein
MSNPRQPSLFQTSKQQETKCRRIDRENREAARIILSEVRYQGGLMEEWARRIVSPFSIQIVTMSEHQKDA